MAKPYLRQDNAIAKIQAELMRLRLSIAGIAKPTQPNYSRLTKCEECVRSAIYELLDT